MPASRKRGNSRHGTRRSSDFTSAGVGWPFPSPSGLPKAERKFHLRSGLNQRDDAGPVCISSTIPMEPRRGGGGDRRF